MNCSLVKFNFQAFLLLLFHVFAFDEKLYSSESIIMEKHVELCLSFSLTKLFSFENGRRFEGVSVAFEMKDCNVMVNEDTTPPHILIFINIFHSFITQKYEKESVFHVDLQLINLPQSASRPFSCDMKLMTVIFSN